MDFGVNKEMFQSPIERQALDLIDDLEFKREVRDALTYLYDHTHLQCHTLAKRLVPSSTVTSRTRAQELRRILLDAIEELNPSNSVPIRAVERRSYAILFGLYVEGRTWQEVAASLGIGGRQLRRDRAAAVEALASILRDRYLSNQNIERLSGEQELLRLESERLAQQREPTDISTLVESLFPLLETVARERGVGLFSHVKSGLPKPNMNRTLLRQALISLANYVLTNLPLAKITFEARLSELLIGIGLSLEYSVKRPQTEDLLDHPGLKPAEILVATMGARLLHESKDENGEKIWVLLPLREEMIVLVVDDNPELFALFERFAVGHPYRLIHAASANQALNLVQTLSPDIITLDLMMPDNDGWELLNALKSDSNLARIPVIICSVLEEPELAISLGAQMTLKKPIGQADLLRALGEVKKLVWEQEVR